MVRAEGRVSLTELFLNKERADELRAAIVRFQGQVGLRDLALARRLGIGHSVLVRFMNGGTMDARRAARVWESLELHSGAAAGLRRTA